MFIEFSDEEATLLVRMLNDYKPNSYMELEMVGLLKRAVQKGIAKSSRGQQVSTMPEAVETQPDADTKS